MIIQKCRICGEETAGMYGTSWPVCFNCYYTREEEVLAYDKEWQKEFDAKHFVFISKDKE